MVLIMSNFYVNDELFTNVPFSKITSYESDKVPSGDMEYFEG